MDSNYVNAKKRSLPSDFLCAERLVSYVHDEDLIKETQKIPKIGHRNAVVAELIKTYGLLHYMKVIPSVPATEDELCAFHSSSYISYLKTINEQYGPEDEVDLEYGLGYDCPLVEDIFSFVCHIAGGTLTAARTLTKKQADVAINWCGGWHHAQRDEAEGYCYVNDIVLGVQELKTVFDFILYIDFDIHHGNGVENAFAFSYRVLTLSFHNNEPGFYPGTGNIDNIGLGSGKYFSVNVPLAEGITDKQYCELFDKIAATVNSRYRPDAIVVQCGSDCLAGDPVGNFNLTPSALSHCIETILGWHKPTLFLGGGGYNISNTARCWTLLTSTICNQKISSDIPDNKYFTEFGPDYDLEIMPSNRRNHNLPSDIETLTTTVLRNLQNIVL